MASVDVKEIRAKAKRRAVRAWEALEKGEDPSTVVKHKLLVANHNPAYCQFDWHGELGVATVTVWREKTGRICSRLHAVVD